MKDKVCTKCRKRKNLAAFGPCRNVVDGRASWCRKCTSNAARKCRKNNPRHYKRYAQQYISKNPLMTVYKNMKTASRHRGQGRIQLTYNDLKILWKKQNGICYWTGRPMVGTGSVKHNPDAVSADRLDRHKTYVHGNVVLCCRWVNLGRSSTPFEQWMDLIKSLNLKGLWA